MTGSSGFDRTLADWLQGIDAPDAPARVFEAAFAEARRAHADAADALSRLRAAGLAVGPYELVSAAAWAADPRGVLARLGRLALPVFVKPARAGSSVGITRVSDPADLPAAIELARAHDPRVIVEQGFLGVREIECGVLDGPDGPRASVCAEIVVRPGHDFYDFEAKYLEDAVDLIVPADLPAEVAASVRAQAVSAFEALTCEGLARVDFFVTPDGQAVVNEVNTMPGFTSISMFPRMWQASGLTYPQLVDHLISDALRRGTGLR